MKQTIYIALSLIGLVAGQTPSSHKPGDLITPAEREQIKTLRSHISKSDCEFYHEYDKLFDYCGTGGYAIGFGYHYCEQFREQRSEFQQPEWQDAVRSCLQTSLLDFTERLVAYPTCKQISDAGFNSHQKCYVSPDPKNPELSWCNLPFMDMVTVAWIAKGDYWDMIAQGFPILLKCFTAIKAEKPVSY